MAGGVAKVGWKVVGIGSGLIGAKIARKLVDTSWRKTKGGDPPRNPAAPETEWKEAIAWALASGMALGIARLLSTKAAASAWKKTTGSLPPGLEDVGA